MEYTVKRLAYVRTAGGGTRRVVRDALPSVCEAMARGVATEWHAERSAGEWVEITLPSGAVEELA